MGRKSRLKKERNSELKHLEQNIMPRGPKKNNPLDKYSTEELLKYIEVNERAYSQAVTEAILNPSAAEIKARRISRNIRIERLNNRL